MKKKTRELTAFGQHVKIRLIEIGSTQTELAETIGTTKQYLGKILYGERSGCKYIDKINEYIK